MKLNGLQLRRALSAALFVLLLSVAGMKNALAQNQVAVLQHNDTITAFYGADAFIQANAAANDGDTITLSSGNFNGECNISKAITLHGAGMVSDSLGVTRTKISGRIGLTNNDASFLVVEGIYFEGSVSPPYFTTTHHSLYHAIFNKCYFGEFSYHTTYYSYTCFLYDVSFYNCLFGSCQVRSASDSVAFYNCVLNSFRNITSSSSPTVFAYNSIIKPLNYDQEYLNLYNCIICGNVSRIISQYADHCILIGETFPSTVAAYDCMTVSSYDEVFETWDGTFAIDADYSLKSEIANTFLGNNGVQVGIYGGFMPYNPRPSYLRPYRCIVPGYTTTDGQLNIEVEVAPEE